MKAGYGAGLTIFLGMLAGLAQADPVVTFQVPLKLDSLPPEFAKAPRHLLGPEKG